ncbi:polysaccharide pyruvyl transferase family protein [Priestia megaterium]|uniref:polysaccharide pyruvyl transferase family protein n=1 Tax=Priestia megaterium TaxID=1404 RepID=UPI0035B5FCBA
MTVALWGYYGTNYGDDIMMDVIIRYFEQYNVDVKLIDIYGSNLETKTNNKYSNVEVIPFYGYSTVQKLKAVRDLAKVKINLWGGGTIFTDSDGDGNFKSFASLETFGGKIGYVGVGIGQLAKRNRRLKTKYLLKKSSFTVFRDMNSLERAKKFVKHKQFNLAEDLAYVYFNNLNMVPKYKLDKYILVTWRNLVGYTSLDKEQSIMDAVVEKVKKVMNTKKYETVVLAALDTNFDVESCLTLEKKFKNQGVNVYFDKDSSVENITKLIYNASFHVSGRLHGSIASEFFHIPTLTLSYSPKIDYFYQSINSNKYHNIYDDMDIRDQLINDIIQKKGNKVDFKGKISDASKNFEYMNGYIQNTK